MTKIERETLYSLEDYSKKRQHFRRQVMEHKKRRRLALGENITLFFESELTMRYQIQEMLRAERIFDERGILEEIQAYEPMIPTGSNLKATMFIEFEQESQRKKALQKLIGVEDRVFMKVGENKRIFAIADEDLERENDEKTSAVHFLRFEFSSDEVNQIKQGEKFTIGIDHDGYEDILQDIPMATRDELGRDFC